MCDPGSIIAASTLAVEAGGKVASYMGQKKQAKAVATAADNSARQQIGQVSLRETQTQDSASQSILQADRQARAADAEARVSAGESGVAGASVDALLNDVQRQDSEYKTATNVNTQDELAQLEAEKQGIRVQAANQKAAVPQPSTLALGTSLVGAGLDFGSVLIRRQPKPQA